MSCDVAKAVGRQQLGKAVPFGRTKADVMHSFSSSGLSPKFSKYSGIVEWRNAMILWVNVGGKDYTNSFSEGGRVMQWFAGSAHQPHTPVIQRVLKVKKPLPLPSSPPATAPIEARAAVPKPEPIETGETIETCAETGAETGNGGGGGGGTGDGIGSGHVEENEHGDVILLMCRVQPGPYVCCGRVSVEFETAEEKMVNAPRPSLLPSVSTSPPSASSLVPRGYNPGARPLRFFIRLHDFDAMMPTNKAPDSPSLLSPAHEATKGMKSKAQTNIGTGGSGGVVLKADDGDSEEADDEEEEEEEETFRTVLAVASLT